MKPHNLSYDKKLIIQGAFMNSANKFMILLAPALISINCQANEASWTDIPAKQWQGNTQADVPALSRKAAAAVALPAKDAKPLLITTASAEPAGLYEVRLTLRPSHVADATAFNSGLRVNAAGTEVAEFAGQFFARVHEPETRTFQFVLPAAGPINLSLSAFSSASAVDTARTANKLKKGGPQLGEDILDTGTEIELGLTLTPDRAVYYIVDKAEFRPLSRSGCVSALSFDKIRYNPGDTLKGTVTVTDAGHKGGDGTVSLYLEHNVKDRTKVKSLPVKLTPSPQTLAFEIPLPAEELGYALVAEFTSADGSDRSETAEYFTIATNFNRVAIYGANPGGTRDVTVDEDTIRQGLTSSRADYFNACEYFFWAEDDLLAMTPTNADWFSGQANYHYNKKTLQNQIRLAHEQGISMVTYGKWCIDGPIGWETVYDRPLDFQGNYTHPVGMWEGVNSVIFDRRRNGEQVPYSPRPNGKGVWFDDWWSDFLGVTPDATPANVRRAAEETLRSIDMFGWDGIRWDGHPRGAGWAQCGNAGNYQAWAARQTQTFVRYFKDLVNARHPGFGHGYNYFLISPKKDYAWAVEDFELDELARGGGLLMNESIGNASGGWNFESIVQNLQVDGDLSRERGGCYLGISFAKSPRDVLVESALWAAAGCRPYGEAMNRTARRYCTRYAQYTFDENLRRLAAPEKVLAPQNATRLWWQPFVYETPLADGKRQLVVNLFNIPLKDIRPPREGKVAPKWDMPPGTDPVTFALTLPSGIHATGVNLIDPQTLGVTPLALKDDRFEIPAVASWSVAIIDLAVTANAPSLGQLYGPPKTFGVPRPNVKAEERRPEVNFNPTQEIWEVNKSMAGLAPEWTVKSEVEQAAFEALSPAEKTAALLKKRAEQSPANLMSQWWKGGSLPDDLKLTNKVFKFGDLSPERNGRFDIYYARGAMDYRLHMTQVFAGLDRFSIHDAPFGGGFRGGSSGMWLADAVPWSHYPDYDLLLFTGIPHAAIGAENGYGMVEYVKAGGAVFFTGGEYAFGKGGYLFTVLERELLPVLCTEMKDTRTSAQPIVMEPGKDFAELKCKLDFGAKPSFWVYNQVVLKDAPGIKVFLTSAKGPVLVGWQVGKGRVACLLVDYRGKSENGVTAFFDWADWPGLAQAVFAWLAPDAGKINPPRIPPSASEAKKRSEKLDQDVMNVMNDTSADGGANPLAMPELDPVGKMYASCLALPLIKTADRVEEGRKLVSQWNAAEKAVIDQWTGGKGFSPAAPELPGLNAESLFQRAAWLAYLSRHDPKSFGAQFAREWLMTSQYQDYCGRSIANKKAGDWTRLSATFGQLRDLTRPVLDELLKTNPDVVAEGFSKAHFTLEFKAAMNVLGDHEPASTTDILKKLKTANNPDLATFATSRLHEKAQ